MVFENLTKEIIASAIEVHRIMGPGLLESAYEECMCYELKNRGLTFEVQKPIPVVYKQVNLQCGYRADIIVENKVIIELKSVEMMAPVHEAQILTYMRFAKIKIGLLMNFNVTLMKNGINRYIL